MTNKIRVLILFGGRSTEHEVSLLSARNVLHALDRDRFEPVLVSIDKQGRWKHETPAALEAATGDPRLLRLREGGTPVEVRVYPETDSERRLAARPQAPLSLLCQDDVVFPVLHGTYGEDGTVQGLLELAGVGYVGAGVLGSSVGMDKDVTKRLLRDGGIPVVDWRIVTAFAYRRDAAAARALASELGFPCFVKPANAGSSVGVVKVKDPSALDAALRQALEFDTKVLVERAVDAREIECAVLGNDDPQASIPGEIIVSHSDGFYSYDAKYVDPDGSSWRIPAELPQAKLDEVRALAVKAFRILELFGLARIDFFVDRRTGALYLNEVNTLPGFTAISMYPKMWEATGIAQRELVTRLIELAIERRDARRALKTSVE